MRRIVLQMMTTLNGRLDDPIAWVHAVSDDQYRDIDRLYAGYDTVLVGRITYEEMAAYWPGALTDPEGTDANRSMARRMRDIQKCVFSRTGGRQLTQWENTEQVVVDDNAELVRRLHDLKAGPGGDIHLAGGASFAQTVLGLGLVDEYRFFLYPAVSPGTQWFAPLPDGLSLRLLEAKTCESGAVGLRYVPRSVESAVVPRNFTDLLT